MLSHVRLNWSKWSSKVKRILDLDDSTSKDIGILDDSKSGAENSNQHLNIARQSLEFMLKDKRIPDTIRESLMLDYNLVQQMLVKLEKEHIHISVLGRVSVGKSSLLNVLMGNYTFSVSPLHGETKQPELSRWNDVSEQESLTETDDIDENIDNVSSDWKEFHLENIFFIDTPGINEVDGLEREKMALEVVSRSDIILFVVDGDITDTEYQALRKISTGVQPVVLVLNKIDRYTVKERELLLSCIKERVKDMVREEYVVYSQSQKSLKHYIKVDENNNETEFTQEIDVNVTELKILLYEILQKEGKTLAALNAVFFAGKLSEQVALRLIETQKHIAEKVIHTYSITKGVAVAVNPVPIADLMAAAVLDIGLVVHLSRIYGLPLSKSEAGHLIKVIMLQMIMLMGPIWAMNLLSSALKLGSAGLSTFLTASAQGAVAYYGTFVIGQAADLYFKQGKSWGELGPKQAVKNILNSIDRDSIIAQAKEDIMVKIK